MIKPILLSGAKMALLAPTTIFACPLAIFLYSSYFSAGVNSLCKMATFSLNLAKKLRVAAGVKDISGTNIRTVFPLARTCFDRVKYTSLLPLPVTPSRR